MAIEIYKEPELEEMIYDSNVVDEWKNEVEKLALEGQKKMIEKESNPSIYILMNTHLLSMFSILCPTKMKYTEYDKSTIPLEVIKEIALCVHEKYFHTIEIWYDDLELDPIVVGKIKDSYDSPRHLIARWGDDILPFSELKIKAINRLSESLKAQHKEMETLLDKASRELVESGRTIVLDFNKHSFSAW